MSQDERGAAMSPTVQTSFVALWKSIPCDGGFCCACGASYVQPCDGRSLDVGCPYITSSEAKFSPIIEVPHPTVNERIFSTRDQAMFFVSSCALEVEAW